MVAAVTVCVPHQTNGETLDSRFGIDRYADSIHHVDECRHAMTAQEETAAVFFAGNSDPEGNDPATMRS
jgi:hypothetical protein